MGGKKKKRIMKYISNNQSLLFQTQEHGWNQLNHWSAHLRQKHQYFCHKTLVIIAKTVIKVKNSQLEWVSTTHTPIAIRTMSKRPALSRKPPKPLRAGLCQESMTVKMAKYLPYTYTLSLGIIAGHNQTIYTDLNRPLAELGKDRKGRSPSTILFN